MITLKGKNLGERHKELNSKVEVSAQNNVAFQTVRSALEVSDVDRLFKIDLASKYRKIDYIVEQLKCGDSLYISRALKCEWIYDDDYAHIINPDYLHDNIFPKMSPKMKNKTLSTISIYIRDETRAQLFYEYCKEENMTKQAYKFLVFTSESYKQEFLSNKSNFIDVVYDKTCSRLIGDSFILLDTYGKMGGLIKSQSNMYSINETEFLNLYEKYTDSLHYVPSVKVGAKMSQSILKKHKDRILKNPPLYLSMLKTSKVLKYSSPDDAKIYVMALLPKDVSGFWNINFCVSYKHIIDIIKTDKFKFMKKIFTDKYPCEEFEMSKNFHRYGYYELMNADEKESWALKHLEQQTWVESENERLKWYAFVRFATAYDKIQKQILNASDMSVITELLNILVKSAKTHKEIEEVLYFYYEIYETHFNARKDMLRSFLDTVIKHHNVLDFDDSCWCAFDKLLQTLGLYVTISEHNELLDISIIYHIISYNSFPYDLTNYLGEAFFSYITRFLRPFRQLSEERKKLVYDYMFKFYMNKISLFESRVYNVVVKNEVQPYLKQLANVKHYFKNKDAYPDIVIKFMKLDPENFNWCLGIKNIVITEAYLIRCLKQNPAVILDQFHLIQEKLTNSNDIFLHIFLKKMKIYFSNDLAKQYLELCKKSLFNIRSDVYSKQKLILANVLTIFILGDESDMYNLMDKYAPSRKKIDRFSINPYALLIQEAICRFQCYSRPPVAFAKSRLYLKGDYLHKCEEIFNVYLVNLTLKELTQLIKVLLVIPSPTQKRGFRLAFQAMKTSGKENYVSNLWSKMINFTMRKNLYTFTIDKMRKETPSREKETFAVLIELTSDVQEDDEEEVFIYFRGNKIPENLRGHYLQTAWQAVSALPENNTINIKRRTLVVNAMKSNIALLNEEFVMSFINDCLQKKWVDLKGHPENNPSSDMLELNNAKWDFLIEYIANISNEEKEEKSLSLVKDIVNHCFDHWNQKYDEDFCYQLFFKGFINKLDENTSCSGKKYSRATSLFEYLLKSFEDRIGVTEMYSNFWDWQLLLLTRKAIDGRDECDKAVYMRFGLELGKFVIKLKMRNCYYTSFLRKIFGKISKAVEILCDLKMPPLTDRYVKILIAYGLTLHDMFETYVLALEVLPQDLSNSPVNETELQEMIKKIKEENNGELTALMNDKFIYSDLKERKIL